MIKVTLTFTWRLRRKFVQGIRGEEWSKDRDSVIFLVSGGNWLFIINTMTQTGVYLTIEEGH